jgi:ABC-type polar amino acid transport system ATPase subunit
MSFQQFDFFLKINIGKNLFKACLKNKNKHINEI